MTKTATDTKPRTDIERARAGYQPPTTLEGAQEWLRIVDGDNRISLATRRYLIALLDELRASRQALANHSKAVNELTAERDQLDAELTAAREVVRAAEAVETYLRADSGSDGSELAGLHDAMLRLDLHFEAAGRSYDEDAADILNAALTRYNEVTAGDDAS